MKLHHYAFSFVETQSDTERTAAVSMGVPNPRVTAAAISKARAAAGMTPSAALLAVSYLGHMTMEEFKNEAE